MKRKVYEVRMNGELKATKYAWNTAKRCIWPLIREQLEPGQKAHETAWEAKKDDHGYFHHATAEWLTSDGRSFTFEVERVAQ